MNHIWIWTREVGNLVTCRHIYWGRSRRKMCCQALCLTLGAAAQHSIWQGRQTFPSCAARSPHLKVETQEAGDRLKDLEL